MRFRLYREFGALNSKPVFDAFEKGLLLSGHSLTDNHSDVDVIWSVLWNGRMRPNAEIYESAKRSGKPIVILEVGSLIRGTTWKVSLNHIDSTGYYGNVQNLHTTRPATLGIQLRSNPRRNQKILLALQRSNSLQWRNELPINEWVNLKIAEIRQYSDREIVIRPHPRESLQQVTGNRVSVEIPKRLSNTYDSFDIDYNYHCVVNHNSGPSIQAAIHGIPVICNSTSLAFPVSSKIETIDNPTLPDRTEWFLKLAHTEWTLDEISSGIPIQRIL